jgi:hypothetical protein
MQIDGCKSKKFTEGNTLVQQNQIPTSQPIQLQQSPPVVTANQLSPKQQTSLLTTQQTMTSESKVNNISSQSIQQQPQQSSQINVSVSVASQNQTQYGEIICILIDY